MALLTNALLLVRHPFVRRAGLKDPNNKTIWWSIHWTTDDDRFRSSSVPMVRLDILFKVPGTLTKLLSSVVAATNRYILRSRSACARSCSTQIFFPAMECQVRIGSYNRRSYLKTNFSPSSFGEALLICSYASVCRLPPPNEQIERVANRNPCRFC